MVYDPYLSTLTVSINGLVKRQQNHKSDFSTEVTMSYGFLIEWHNGTWFWVCHFYFKFRLSKTSSETITHSQASSISTMNTSSQVYLHCLRLISLEIDSALNHEPTSSLNCLVMEKIRMEPKTVFTYTQF